MQTAACFYFDQHQREWRVAGDYQVPCSALIVCVVHRLSQLAG